MVIFIHGEDEMSIETYHSWRIGSTVNISTNHDGSTELGECRLLDGNEKKRYWRSPQTRATIISKGEMLAQLSDILFWFQGCNNQQRRDAGTAPRCLVLVSGLS